MFNGKIHYKSQCSIAMLVITRGYRYFFAYETGVPDWMDDDISEATMASAGRVLSCDNNMLCHCRYCFPKKNAGIDKNRSSGWW